MDDEPSEQELEEFCKDKEVVIREENGKYIAGETALHTYIYTSELYDNMMVLGHDTEHNIAVCVNTNFDTIVGVNSSSLKASDIIKYQRNGKITETI